MRENPQTLDVALEIAIGEQNLRTRFALRTTDSPENDEGVGEAMDTSFFEEGTSYQLENVTQWFLHSQPEIEVSESVSRVSNGRYITIQILNHSNKHVRLKRGCIMGTLTNIASVNPVENQK